MRRALAFLPVAAAALLVGCATSDHSPEMADTPAADAVAFAHIVPSANARNDPKFAMVSGEVTFAQRGDETQVLAIIHGLPANGSFGFHIHEKTDLSEPDLKSAGPHWNPGHKHHGGPDSGEHHAGDLGNVTSDANGVAKVNFKTHAFTVTGENSVLDHSVVLHASADDMKSDPAGNSGTRIAGGIIWKQ